MDDLHLLWEALKKSPLDNTLRGAIADELVARDKSYEDAVVTVDRLALESRISAFVAHLDAVLIAHWKERNYTFAPPPVHVAEYKDKWCLIVRKDKREDGTFSNLGSATAFVALTDFSNRELGTVRAGDIHKPASYKKPAKHARGSVWLDDFGNCCGPSGHIHYLR